MTPDEFERLLRVATWTVILALAGAAIYLAMGCTITPKIVASPGPSLDGNDANSGIVSADANGAIVTAYYRSAYNALAAVYGKDLLPPVKPDDGLIALPDGTWRIDHEHEADEIIMTTWHRMGRLP
jgi:hypothetical protein